MNVGLIIVEGVHLRRGTIAALCCRHAMKNVPVLGLSWNEPYLAIDAIEIESHSTVEQYYSSLQELLATAAEALVIPCTQSGTLISNTFADRHSVLAEPTLSGPSKFDKLALKASQCDLHRFFPTYSANPVAMSYPFLAKPRQGHSSSSQHMIASDSDLKKLKNAEGYFFESIIPSPMEEYSLTVVRSHSTTRWMCIRREIQCGGRTVKGSQATNQAVQVASNMIVDRLAFSKVFNVQFAMRNGSPLLYDLNPRFGHSELYRTCFGFNFVSAYADLPAKALCNVPSLSEPDAFDLLSCEPMD